MGGLSLQEKKGQISQKLEEAFKEKKDNCKSRAELSNYFESKLTSDQKKFLEEYEVEKYFLTKKEEYLNDFSELLLEKKTNELNEKNEKREKELAEKNEKREKELMEKFEKNMLEQQKQNQELQEKLNQRQKEQDDAIKKLMEQHTRNIQSLQNEAFQQQKKYDEQQRKAEKESRELLEKLEKKYKEERDEEKKNKLLEEKKKLEELEKKRKEVQKKFNESIEVIKREKVDEIIKEFKLIEDKFCLDEISKFDRNKIKDLIMHLFKNEKILKNVLFNLNVFIDNVKNKISNVEHLNIILVGPCGVGKSTLINAVLELETKAVTGFGKPQTQNIEFHSSKKIPFLRLADSKGIEKSEDAGVNAIYNSIKNFIDLQIQNKDPDKYIHCIWYCWTGSRLEDVEIEILKKLSSHYSLSELPVIIVYTNAIDEDLVKQAKDYIANEIGIKNDFVDVLSKEKPVKFGNQILKIPPKNLDKLREISIKLAMSAVNSSCYQGLIGEIKEKINNSIIELAKELELKIGYEIKTIKSKMDEKSKFEELYENCTHIILDIYYKYIFLNPNIKIKDYKNPKVNLNGNTYMISIESQSLILDFVIGYFKESLLNYEKKLNELLTKYTNELCNEIIKFQMEFREQNENYFKTPWTSLELEKIIKKYLHDNLANMAKLANLKNSFSYISTPIIFEFGEYFKNSYAKGMTRPEFIENAKNVIKVPFNKIENKIKEYNEMMKKKAEENVQEMAPTPLDVEHKTDDKEQVTNKPTDGRTTEQDLDKLSWD